MQIGPDDAEGATRAAERLSVAFHTDTGHDPRIGHHLLLQRWAFLDGRLDHWTVDDLMVLLLDVVPRTLRLAEEDIDRVVPDTRAFLRWLHHEHGITGDPLPRLLGALDRMTDSVPAAMHGRSHNGLATSGTADMEDAGSDTTRTGWLRDHDARRLLGGIADLPQAAAVAAVQMWAADRSDPLDELVTALLGRDEQLLLGGAVLALVTVAGSAVPAVAESQMRRLLGDPLLQPIAIGWLQDHRLPVPEVPRRIDRLLVSMAALGAPEDAVVMLDDIGLVDDQISVVQEARAQSGTAAIALLEAVVDLHGEPQVVKAARKALFSLGSSRHPSRR